MSYVSTVSEVYFFKRIVSLMRCGIFHYTIIDNHHGMCNAMVKHYFYRGGLNDKHGFFILSTIILLNLDLKITTFVESVLVQTHNIPRPKTT